MTLRAFNCSVDTVVHLFLMILQFVKNASRGGNNLYVLKCDENP